MKLCLSHSYKSLYKSSYNLEALGKKRAKLQLLFNLTLLKNFIC